MLPLRAGLFLVKQIIRHTCWIWGRFWRGFRECSSLADKASGVVLLLASSGAWRWSLMCAIQCLALSWDVTAKCCEKKHVRIRTIWIYVYSDVGGCSPFKKFVAEYNKPLNIQFQTTGWHLDNKFTFTWKRIVFGLEEPPEQFLDVGLEIFNLTGGMEQNSFRIQFLFWCFFVKSAV